MKSSRRSGRRRAISNSACSSPAHGSAWIDNNGCTSRVARGGSWNVVPAAIRSANRLLITEQSLYFNLGLRVARTLVGP